MYASKLPKLLATTAFAVTPAWAIWSWPLALTETKVGSIVTQ